MEPRLSFVTLGVADVARARAFYETLGFKASPASNENVAFFDAGGMVLSLFGRDALAKDAGVAAPGTGFTGIALAHNVRTADDVARVLDEAKAAGATIVKTSQKAFWGGQTGYFADLDGHLWEVAHNPFFPLDANGRVTLPGDPPAELGDAEIRDVLKNSRTFAVVGASDNPARPSHGVMAYLQAKGYDVIPVNPTLAGRQLLGVTVVASLDDIDRPVDVVDIFRNSEAALDVVREAVREKDRLAIKTVWMQIGVINEAAAAEAHVVGLNVIMDRCPKIEYARLMHGS